jgi:hypothetical protein
MTFYWDKLTSSYDTSARDWRQMQQMADAHAYENRALALCNTTAICVLEEHNKSVCSMHTF